MRLWFRHLVELAGKRAFEVDYTGAKRKVLTLERHSTIVVSPHHARESFEDQGALVFGSDPGVDVRTITVYSGRPQVDERKSNCEETDH